MHYVISNTGAPFQFNLGAGAVYSFDTETPIAISDSHYQTIVERIGTLCLKEVEAPQEEVKAETVQEEAPAPQE